VADAIARQAGGTWLGALSGAGSHFSRFRRAVAAGLAAAAGLATLVAQLSAGAPSALGHHPAIDGMGAVALHALGVAGGLGLLLIAHGLWRGKRRAVYVAAGALCLTALARGAFGLGPLDVGVDLALAALLVANRGAFRRGQTPVARTAAVSGTVALIAAAGLYVAYALIVLAVARRTDTDQAIALAGRGLLAGAGWASTNWWVRLLLDTLIATTIVAGAAFLHALLRPARPREGHTRDERARALRILRRHSADSLDPFALREDKAFHFEANGLLAYRVLHETAVVSGDPIGPPGASPSILGGFMRYADQRGWDVVVTGASGSHLASARELGLHALRIGDEAVVEASTFSLEGRPIRKVRQSVARVERRGWTVETVAGSSLTAELAGELRRVESEWRSRQRRLIGFSMTLGRLASTDEDVGALYVLARDPEGRVRSFLRFAAFRDGLSLDLMRRLGDEPNGVTEAQVVAAIEYARSRGIRSVSLNFAGFAHVMAADAALSRGQRLLRFSLRAAHGRFQLERLVQFNAKFFPSWQPRYLLYGRLTHLPMAALRVLQAEAYLPERTPATRSGAWAWQRWAVGAIVLLAALAGPTELLVRRSTPSDKPLHVLATLDQSQWSFTYSRPAVSPTSNTLYLPEGRSVMLRFAGREPPRPALARELPDQPPGRGRTLRLRASHPGILPVPCAPTGVSARCLIKADVLRSHGFWARLGRDGTVPSPPPPAPEAPSLSPKAPTGAVPHAA
jgi:lysyl-tRNA synthetase, class II